MNADFNTKMIVMSKKEAAAAGKPNTVEYNTLVELMKNFPSFRVEVKTSTKRKTEFKGLDYKYMKNYIQKCTRDDKDDLLAEFNTLIAQDKKDKKSGSEYLEAASYIEVKNWFLSTFPEIKQFKEDHDKKIKEILTKSVA